MYRHLRSLLICLVLASGCGDDGPVEGALEALGLSENVDVQTPPGPATVDDVISRLDAEGFNGIVLIDDAGRLRVEPLGRVDGPDSAPIDEHTVFDIGSITKQFTGAAIVRLEMDGRLSVDDPLGDHLADVDPTLADLTLHQLLTHTAGLPDSIGDDYEPIDRAGFLARAAARSGDPGGHTYSNVGYSLLGMVVESVSGTSYEAYLREVFFDPLGMDSTGYVLPDFDPASVAVGFIGAQRLDRPNDLPWGDDGPFWNLRANGGMLSTAADMRRWVAALDGDEVLSDAAQTKLFGRHVEEGPDVGTFYGYGWVSFPLDDGGWMVGHNGGNGIFFADLLYLPDVDLTVFVATNHAGADEDAAFRIAETLVEGGVGAECLPAVNPTAFPVATDYPDTGVGVATEALMAALLGGADADRRTFAEHHVSESLAQGLSLDEQVAELALLGEEFLGYTVEMIHIEDPLRLHVVLESSTSDSLIVSVATTETDPARIGCLEVSG
jgi:CubicO group peptidase (beta-lactamase class C family)